MYDPQLAAFEQELGPSSNGGRSAGASNIRLAEILGALSHALDMVEGQPPGHCVRCCWIGIHIAQEIGLPESEISDLYYTLLLKDAGCSSNAARVCQLYLTDDISFKRDLLAVNGSLPQVLRFVLTHTGMNAGLAERFRALVNIFQNGGEIANELIETRCDRGAAIARKMRFSEPVAQSIYNLDEQWSGRGMPSGLSGEEIPLYSRIALLAQVIDIFHVTNGAAAATREIQQRNGTWFDPRLVAAFERASQKPAFWTTLGSADIQTAVFALEPAQSRTLVDESYLDDIAAAFAQVIDSKSPFTSGHSERVTLFADMIAEQLGYPLPVRRLLKRAALLHDIGKLGVSNSILDKPDKLDTDEWVAMQAHTLQGEKILSQIAAFKDIAVIAGAHHERLDGKGYPRGLKGDQISRAVRIVTTADIFDALTADRPYRRAMPVDRALAVMAGMLATAIDPVCLDALRHALRRADPALAA